MGALSPLAVLWRRHYRRGVRFDPRTLLLCALVAPGFAGCVGEFPAPRTLDAGEDLAGRVDPGAGSPSPGGELPDRKPPTPSATPGDPAGPGTPPQPQPARPDSGAPLPDAAPPPPPIPMATLEIREPADPIPGCQPTVLTLVWRTSGVDRCTLVAEPPMLVPMVGAADLASGEGRVEPSEDTTFVLDCEGPGGAATDTAQARFAPVLPLTHTIGAREAVVAAQRVCAAALGEMLVSAGQPGEPTLAFVHRDEASAARMCFCEGYRRVTESWGERKCFHSPGDNNMGYWNGNNWEHRPAAQSNICIQRLGCAEPVTRCDELLYPR